MLFSDHIYRPFQIKATSAVIPGHTSNLAGLWQQAARA